MKHLTLFLLAIALGASAHAVPSDSTFFFKTSLSVTNNGFSIIPAFTLGKPAALLDMGIGNRRLSFEPQFRYALEGRPWSFVFIYRYKAIIKPKFNVSLGGHIPGLNYITRAITVNGVTENFSVARRFLAAEVIANYRLSERVWVGLYYLHGFGFQYDSPRNSDYLSFRASLPKLHIGKRILLDVAPQVFYLGLDGSNGYYVNATTTLSIKNFPISISSIVNKAVQSDIAAKDFDWNVSLVYNVDRRYVRRN